MLLNPNKETIERKRSQTQTHVELTSCPRTRSRPARRSRPAKLTSNVMMLKSGGLLLVLYGLCQIPLAQGQTPRKDETPETTQTWKSQEAEADTEGRRRETQDEPAPTNSGLLLNPNKETIERKRSQTQTHVELTSCPRTRSRPARRSRPAKLTSNVMMLKSGGLLLVLYGLCQIPLAQGQTPRKDETPETTQTWKSQEAEADTEGHRRETQDEPAPTNSGLGSCTKSWAPVQKRY
ncbi:unnamed protein product [Boreogadus saida]